MPRLGEATAVAPADARTAPVMIANLAHEVLLTNRLQGKTYRTPVHTVYDMASLECISKIFRNMGTALRCITWLLPSRGRNEGNRRGPVVGPYVARELIFARLLGSRA